MKIFTLKRLAFLILIEACLIGSCMAETDFQHFSDSLMRSAEVQRLADEIAYSYPVPLTNHHVAVYGYLVVGLPPKDPKISVPKYYLEALYPSAQIVQFHPISASDLKIPFAEDGTLGTVYIPPEYLSAGADGFFRREKQFKEVYSNALSNYISGDKLDAGSAKQILTELPVFGAKPLMPLLQQTNPDFFAWLEKNAAR